MNEIDLAYLAGAIDGEGSIGIHKSGASHTWDVQVDLYQTNYAWLEQFQNTFGGRIIATGRLLPRWKQQFHWYLGSKEAAQLLRKIKPYLRLKQEQANLCLELQRRIDLKLGLVGRSLTKEEKAIREGLYKKCRLLNERGIRNKQLSMDIPDKPEVEQPRLL